MAVKHSPAGGRFALAMLTGGGRLPLQSIKLPLFWLGVKLPDSPKHEQSGIWWKAAHSCRVLPPSTVSLSLSTSKPPAPDTRLGGLRSRVVYSSIHVVRQSNKFRWIDQPCSDAINISHDAELDQESNLTTASPRAEWIFYSSSPLRGSIAAIYDLVSIGIRWRSCLCLTVSPQMSKLTAILGLL